MWWLLTSITSLRLLPAVFPALALRIRHINDVRLEFDPVVNEWVMSRPDSEPNWVYRYALPDSKLQAFFDNNLQYIPSYEAMQAKAKQEF
jgi:hypothetical protein